MLYTYVYAVLLICCVLIVYYKHDLAWGVPLFRHSSEDYQSILVNHHYYEFIVVFPRFISINLCSCCDFPLCF